MILIFCHNILVLYHPNEHFHYVPASSKPFVLNIVTDANEAGDIGNRGFSLDFTQRRCTGLPF